MTDIKIRYTWKRKSDGFLEQDVQTIEEIEQDSFNVDRKRWELIARDLSTGWKDKNGNDIYKGDLIREDGWEGVFEVIWQAHSGQWIMQHQIKGLGYRHMAYDYAQRDCEVVGNKYLNPEMLYNGK